MTNIEAEPDARAMAKNPAETVVSRFGGRNATARALNQVPRPEVVTGRRSNPDQPVAPSTVGRWVVAGRIPDHWFEPLLVAARRHGLALERSELESREKGAV